MVTLSRCLWDRAEQRRAQQEKQRQRKGGQEVLQRRGMRIRAGAGKRRAADDVAATTAAPPERKPSRRRVSRKKLDCFSELMLRLLGLQCLDLSAYCCIRLLLYPHAHKERMHAVNVSTQFIQCITLQALQLFHTC